jgi:hypothetical protein
LPNTTTIARLRTALADDFPGFDAFARRLREAGLLPAGTGGRNGVGSAPLDLNQAALLFLALISGEAPIDAPEAAAALAAYDFAAFFHPLVGPCTRHDVPEEAQCTLGEWLAGEIEFAIDPDHRVVGLYVEANRISTLDPDDIAEFERRPGDPPVLRDVNIVRERLEFTPAVKRPEYDDRGRPLACALSTIVHPEVIRAVASAFALRRLMTTTLLSGGGAA